MQSTYKKIADLVTFCLGLNSKNFLGKGKKKAGKKTYEEQQRVHSKMRLHVW